MTVTDGSERIGLLFVHGIGEQPRWDHLKSSVQDMAELLLQTAPGARVTVVDRTADWPHPPGEPDPDGLAPITMTFAAGGRTVTYECFEVWWADLGARAGLLDVVTFWLWGLGQWAAPIYRELDAAGLPKVKHGHLDKPVSDFATLPESVAGNLGTEPLSRMQLVLAALAALFVAVTWTLAKRLFAALLGKAPPPTLIVRYVGDVRTYEARAAPGDSALTDPARPRRVGIRRRMVSEMVALGTAPLDGWYVLAHSLGTVVAYNGLTEIGHALPNYLAEEQWQRVPAEYRRDPGCRLRKDVGAMMPSRPPWLGHDDVIDRRRLFENLRGFLTYGSPLDKFAGLWPRIVATATDRSDGECAFPPGCRWINLAAPSDPVGGALDSYGKAAKERLKDAIPHVENYRTPWNPLYGLSHIKYFTPVEIFSKAKAAGQKRAVARWLLDPAAEIPDFRQGWFVRLFTEKLAYPALVALLWCSTTAAAVAAIIGTKALFTDRSVCLCEFGWAWWGALRPVLAIALGLILFMGVWRWRTETHLNVKLARADRARDEDPNRTPAEQEERQRYWERLIGMQRMQARAATAFAILAVALFFLAVSRDWGAPTNWVGLIKSEWGRILDGGADGGWSTLAGIAVALALGAIIQTWVNRRVPPVGRAPG